MEKILDEVIEVEDEIEEEEEVEDEVRILPFSLTLRRA